MAGRDVRASSEPSRGAKAHRGGAQRRGPGPARTLARRGVDRTRPEPGRPLHRRRGAIPRRHRSRIDHADAGGKAMTTNNDIQAALNSRDWSGAEVVTERPRAKIVHSVRLPAEWSEALEAEADRRGTTPSRL